MTLDEYKTLEGKEIGVSSWMVISQAIIDAFADVTGDHQFLHVDPELARATPFGGTIAHGFLTLSMLSKMSYEAFPKIDGEGTGVNYGMNRVRFIAPVKSGARIRGRFVLKTLDTSTPGAFTTVIEATVEIDGEDKPALVAEWIGRRYLEPI